jgi:cyclase
MTLKKRIIPCLLLNKWLLAKTIKFGEIRNLGNAAQAAKVYNMRNVDELMFLDIQACRENKEHNLELVKELADECFMPLTLGGGVKSVEDMNKLLQAGADKIAINTAAVETPELITNGAQKFGSQCIVVSIDAKKTEKGYEVFIQSGKKATGLDPVEWAKKVEDLGAGEILITSIDKDGTFEGFDQELTKNVSEAVKIPVIANGGAGKPKDFVDAVKIGGASAVAAASIFQYTQYSPVAVREHMAEAGIDVRTNVYAEHLTGSDLKFSIT